MFKFTSFIRWGEILAGFEIHGGPIKILRAGTYSAFIHCSGGPIPGGPPDVALCPDVASLTVNQFDRCNLLWRSVVRYGTGKTSYSHSPLLRMLDLSQ